MLKEQVRCNEKTRSAAKKKFLQRARYQEKFKRSSSKKSVGDRGSLVDSSQQMVDNFSIDCNRDSIANLKGSEHNSSGTQIFNETNAKINISDANIKITKAQDAISLMSVQQQGFIPKASSVYSEQHTPLPNRVSLSESKSNTGLPIIALNETQLSINPSPIHFTDETWEVEKFDTNSNPAENLLEGGEDLDDRVSIDEFYYNFNSQFKENIRLRAKPDTLVSETDLPGNKLQKEYKSGRKETMFSNGARREVRFS